MRILDLNGGQPAVFGQIEGPAGAPTVLLYAHHDVQPAADPDLWDTPPFEPVVRGDRMYGRGTADDKCGIAIHAAAIRALLADGAPPVTIKVVVEGEEECSTEHLPDLVIGHAELLRADVAIVADGGNARTGEPTIGTSIRGATSITVRVDVLPQAVHSGSFGGPLPDAVMALSRMLASLHDDEGELTVGGLHSFPWSGTEVSEAEFREEAAVYPEVQLFGSGSIADRTLSKPSINILAFEAPRTDEVANQIVPSATAVVGPAHGAGRGLSRRGREGRPTPARCGALGRARHGHPRGRAGQGLPRRHVLAGLRGGARRRCRPPSTHEVLEMGSGGSIPLVPVLVETFPGIEVLIWGAADHLSNYHSRNESVDLGEVVRMAQAEALFLRSLGRGRLSRPRC